MVGFVFQQYHLINDLTMADNVELPLIYHDVPRTESAGRSRCRRPLHRHKQGPMRIRITLLLLAAAAGPASLAAQVPDTLSLEDALRLAVLRSPEIHRAEAIRLQAGADRIEGLGRFLPSIGVSMGLLQSVTLQRTASDPITGGIVALPDSLIERRQTFGTQAGVSASWLLFDGGRRWSRTGAARLRDGAAEYGLAAARVRLTADVALAYLDALEAEAIAEVRATELARARELERTARSRFDIGEIPEIEILQAELARSDAEIALLDAQGEARLARITLLDRIGLTPSPDLVLLPPPEPAWNEDDEALIAHALAASPLLRELESRRRAELLESRAQRRELMPSISAGVSWNRSEFGSTRDAFTFGPRNAGTSLRMSLTWSPLERPGAVVGDRRRAEATTLSAEAAFQADRAILERDVAAGADRLARARVLRERVEISSILAERQLEQAEERYRLGLAPLVERLAAEGLWAEAALQQIVARYAPLRALAGIERATGTPLWLQNVR